MNRTTTAQKIARRAGFLAALASLALTVAPASGLAKAPVKFGAKLDPTVQPSNSLPGLPCSQESVMECTMVQNEAYGRPDGGELAPREMFPGRPYLGFGSGESLNESPLGAEWPPVGEQIGRMEEALETIHALFDGKRLTQRGKHFATDGAFLHTRPEGRRPPIYVSAFGPQAARVAGRLGDGIWTLADPESVPGILDAYKGAAEDAGREPGEVLLQVAFSWAEDDGAALEGARVWKGSQPKEFYREDWHDPAAMLAHAEEQVSDGDLREAMIVSSDPDEHTERIREVERMGADTVVLMNNSGADPHAAIDLYGREVLPKLSRSLTAP